MSPTHDVTTLLAALRGGENHAGDALFRCVYDELRRIAHRELGGRARGQTLGTTAVVHEAYIKLIGGSSLDVTDRRHFFSIASRAMRQVLIDYARRRSAQKRGGNLTPTILDVEQIADDTREAETLIALSDALERLRALDGRLADLIDHRFFAGLSDEEIATLFDVSSRTVRRDWRKARAFLYAELYGESADAADAEGAEGAEDAS